MRKPILTTLLAVTLCTLLGCSDENYGGSSPAGQLPLLLSGQIQHENITRANDYGFVGGDRMGIYVVDRVDGKAGTLGVSDNRANNVLFTYDGDSYSWTSPTTIYWRDQQTPVDIYGYYPGVNYIETPTAYQFSVQTDQCTEAGNGELSGYEQSDLLWGKAANVSYTQEQIVVKYHHILAGVRVQLQKGTGVSDTEWQKLEKIVLLTNTKPEATVDLSTGAVVPLSSTAPIRMVPQSNDQYRAVVIPQQVAANKSLVCITLDGQTYSHSLTSVMNYEAGKLHNFTLTVNKREASGDYQITLAYDGITPWTNDENSHAFSANAYVVVHCPEPGKLEESIRAAGYDSKTLQSLKVTGLINSSDFKLLRDGMPELHHLNLKESIIRDDVGWQRGDDILPGEALYRNKSIRSLVLPSSLKHIGSYALCSTQLANTTLEVPEGVRSVGYAAFNTYDSGYTGVTLILPNSLDSIGNSAFGSCNYDCELKLSDNITYIGDDAFAYAERFHGNFHIPQNLKYLGTGAFRHCGTRAKLTGDLEIPQGIEEIPNDCFESLNLANRIALNIPNGVKKICGGAFSNGPFYDNVYGGVKFSSINLPNSLLQIGNAAFYGVQSHCQLRLPPQIIYIDSRAFYDADVEGELTIPESCVYIGESCFESNLITALKLPSQLEVISARAFWGNPLQKVELPRYVDQIGDEAFEYCRSLHTIVCLNPEPPALGNNVWYGVAFDKCVLQVPEASVSAYRQADGWSQFQNITPYHELAVNIPEVTALDKGIHREGVVQAEGAWQVTDCPSWCQVTPKSGDGKTEVAITIAPQTKGAASRDGQITFSLIKKNYNISVPVSQLSYQYGEDETIILQKASAGAPFEVPLFVVGDGYSAADIQSGKYLQEIKEQVDYLFSCEPFKTYRDYFTVSTSIAVSPQSGIPSFYGSPVSGLTRFATSLTTGVPSCNEDGVWQYAVDHGTAVTREREGQSTVVVLLNTTQGENHVTLADNGRSIVLLSKSTDAYPYDQRGHVLYDVGGVAFGKLGDESVSHFTFAQTCTCNGCSAWKDFQKYKTLGWLENISLSGKRNEVPWAHLIYHEKYAPYVDLYEGAYRHARGIYRSEDQSVMSTFIPYYNTISRESIVKRIMQYAGETYSFDKFVAKDKIEIPE